MLLYMTMMLNIMLCGQTMKMIYILVALTLSQGCWSLEAIEEFEPAYPESPVCRDDEGEVILSFKVLENGSPHKIEIVNSTNKRFVRSAVKTLAKYRFIAGTYDVT